jgi:predicted Zn-dependent peptidase
MATTLPAPDELTRAQRFLVGVRALNLQARASVATQLATLWVYGLPPAELGRESEKILKVTTKDIEAVGAKYFPAARQTIVTVGQENIIKEQLAPFGLEMKPSP